MRTRYWVVWSILALCRVYFAGNVAAFNRDRFTDIVWHDPGSGESFVWFLEGFQRDDMPTPALGKLPPRPGPKWQLKASADFNLDGRPDLFWRNPEEGKNLIWLMAGIKLLDDTNKQVELQDSRFALVGTGDFNSDGYADILWRDQQTHEPEIWFMQGPSFSGRRGTVSPGVERGHFPEAAGDFDNDGNTDIVWRDSKAGWVTIWLMNGSKRRERVRVDHEPPDLKWHIAGTGRFNPLGFTDLLWRNENGANVIWLMRGTSFRRIVRVPAIPNPAVYCAGVIGYTNVMSLSGKAENDRAISLRWREGPAGGVDIRRRTPGTTNWTLLASNHVARTFLDESIEAGKRYEYSAQGSLIEVGAKAAPVERRGRVILVVEEAMARTLEAELAAFKTDLAGDGWSIEQKNVPRHNDRAWKPNIANILALKASIVASWRAAPAEVKSIILVGHAPIPFSGLHNPDGHGSRALPMDGYYGDVDGEFTDYQADQRAATGDSRLDNFPGDGKFDQNQFPPNKDGVAKVELAVGRIDFAELPVFRTREADLLRRYLEKNGRYRRKELVFAERLGVGSFFQPYGINHALFEAALTGAARLYGPQAEAVTESDVLTPSESNLVAIQGGYGSPSSIGGVGGSRTAESFAKESNEPRLGFAFLYGSYFEDFAHADNLLRALVAGRNSGLGSVWLNAAQRARFVPETVGNFSFEEVAVGEPVGQGLVRGLNQTLAEMNAPNGFVSWMGDPTLRWQILAPPKGLRAKTGQPTELDWAASPEAAVQYHVYRATNVWTGPWERLNSAALSSLRFSDSSAERGSRVYQVRALKLTETGSGSFTNLSQGAIAVVNE